MKEETHNFWDIIAQLATAFLVACSLWFSVYQYGRDKRDAESTAFKRDFHQKQNELYAQACEAAGRLVANAGDPKSFEEAKKQFITLYYGAFVLVKDEKVSHAMRELKSHAEIMEAADKHMIYVLEQLVLRFTEACRMSSRTFVQKYVP